MRAPVMNRFGPGLPWGPLELRTLSTSVLEAPPRRRTKRRPSLHDGPPFGGGGNGDGGGGDPRPDRDPGEPDRSPAGATELAFAFLMVAICTLFMVFLLAWAVLRRSETWPSGELQWRPTSLWLSSLLLFASEWAMLRTSGRGDARVTRTWLARATVLGLSFLVAQTWIMAELALSQPELVADAYDSIFYSLIGLHAAHVIGGLVFMSLLLRRLSRSGKEPAGLDLCRIYWHLMSVIWLVVFTLLYFGG